MRRLLLSLLVLCAPTAAQGQDLFVLEVYRPSLEPKGTWEGEAYLNYIARGQSSTDRHAHAALELSHVLSGRVQFAGYALFGRRPGITPEFGGWRLRALIGAPEHETRSVRFGFVAELEHTRPAFADHQWALELVPVFGLARGKWNLAFNPGVELELPQGGGKAEAEFEPSARFVYSVSPRLALSMEYYARLGEVGELAPVVQQVHQFFPGVDLRIGEDISWNVALGVGLTSAGNRVTLKTGFEIPLSEEKHPPN